MIDRLKLIEEAKEQKNWNAYGWLMRWIQVEEDYETIKSERLKILDNVERITEELHENKG